MTIAPLRVGDRSIGVVYIDRPVREDWEREIVELFANQAAVAIHNVSLYEMATLDSLTGAATRRFFDQATVRELRASSRTGAPLSLLIVDVNDMKGLNDTMGHAAGDRALAALGATLRKCVRGTDIVGRIGGDEFAVLLPCTDREGAEIVLSRVRHALAAFRARFDGELFDVSASVGAAILDGRPLDARHRRDDMPEVLERTAIRLFEAADAGMYQSKRASTAAPPTGVAWWLPTPADATPMLAVQ